VLSALVSFSMFLVPLDVLSVTITISGIASFILTTMAYIGIYSAVRRHKNQIQLQQVQRVVQQRADQVAIFSSLAKSAVGIFYVYLVFLVCCLPFFLVLVAIEMKGPSIVVKRFYLSSITLVFFNSSLNPVIYCWKMRHIRHAVINILRNMSWFSDRTSLETLASPGHITP